MNELKRFYKTIVVFVFTGIFFCFSCTQTPKASEIVEEPLIVGGGLLNYAVLNGDTIYEGGWDTGLKSLEVKGDTVVYDCWHLFHGYFWAWCGDSLWFLDTNVVLTEINQKIHFVDSNFWCLTDFNIVAERTDTSFVLNSEFYRGDTIFYQSSHWGLKNYWPIN